MAIYHFVSVHSKRSILVGKVKSLEDENQELKQQIAVLNAFREVQLQEEKMSARKKKNSSMPPDQKSSSSNSSVSKKDGEESSSEEDFDDDNIDTFKVDVEEGPIFSPFFFLYSIIMFSFL